MDYVAAQESFLGLRAVREDRTTAPFLTPGDAQTGATARSSVDRSR